MDVFTHSAVIAGDGEEDLASLVDAVRSGRPAAVDGLVARVQHRVRGWAGRFTDDADAADDVAQEVLIDLERRVRKFDGMSRFSTWLFAVTRHVALSHHRRDRRRALLLEGQPAADQRAEATTTDPDIARLGELVLRYWAELPPRQRQIFELADVRGMAPAEIARQLSMTQTTVRGHLFKARRAIRAKMVEHHERLLTEYKS